MKVVSVSGCHRRQFKQVVVSVDSRVIDFLDLCRLLCWTNVESVVYHTQVPQSLPTLFIICFWFFVFYVFVLLIWWCIFLFEQFAVDRFIIYLRLRISSWTVSLMACRWLIPAQTLWCPYLGGWCSLEGCEERCRFLLVSVVHLFQLEPNVVSPVEMDEKSAPPARIFSYAAGQGLFFHSGAIPRVLPKDLRLFSLALFRTVGHEFGSVAFMFNRLITVILWICAVDSLTWNDSEFTLFNWWSRAV